MEGDVERAFQSGGLDETRLLAKKNRDATIATLEQLSDSKYKAALVEMCDNKALRKAVGRPGSHVKPFTRSKGSKF